MQGANSQAPRHSANSKRQLAVGRRAARADAGHVAHVVEHFLAAAQAQLIERQTQARVRPCGLSCGKQAVERERVLNLGRSQFEQLGNFDHGRSGTCRSRSLTMCKAGNVTAWRVG